MAERFSFKTPLNKWRHCLQDINFWLDGYLKSPAYRGLEAKLNACPYVQWNVGVGPAACFTRAISSIIREGKIRIRDPFDYVIEVDMKQQAAAVFGTLLNINDKLHVKVAEQLGLFQHKPDMADAELRYFTYDDMERDYDTDSLRVREIRQSIAPLIMHTLRTKKYLLVVENLDKPINPIRIDDLTEGLWLPPPYWNGSFWIVSTTSQDVYEKSESSDCVVRSFDGDDILILTLYSLKQAAKYISVAVGHGEEQYWHHVALQCFHYTTMLLIPDNSKVNPPNFDAWTDVNSSDKLIRRWAAQGILTVMEQSIQERKGQETGSNSSKYNDDDIYRVGNVILEAFREYSLLQLPFSPPTKDDEAIKTAAHFLAYHSLIAEPLALDELCEGNHSQLEHIQWISYVDDQGRYVSRDWLNRGASGPTTLIIKNCSEQSTLFMKLQSDHLLAKLSCLRVLDLSYTPLESLPPSICCLQKLQLLSLRGCYNLKSPLSFPDTETTLCQNNSNKKLKLLYYLDISYSNISTFQHDFFHNMPNLKELLLTNCSSFEELPPSTAALSSLTKLELIDNKKFKSFAGLPEISLDGHDALSSFSLVGTPYIKRLSLRGCRKLETVDIKEVDALEELDLSATAIKELPDDIPNLPLLRRLLLMGIPSLRRFPWHKLQRLPNVFCLDQCSDGTVNHSNTQLAQVCISDSRFFYSFNQRIRDFVRSGRLLKSFYVRVTSCNATTRKLHDEEDTVKTNKFQVAQATYADVNGHYLTDGVSMVSMDDVPPIRETERHVEISAVEQCPHGIKYLLAVTKSICLSHDNHVSSLSSLSSDDLVELEECKLQWCHRMVDIFHYLDVRALKNAHVSYLKSLTHLGYAKCTALKHLHLEHCPRLKGVFSRVCDLPSLVTLDILFCYNLKEIFYGTGHSSYSYHELPRLRRIRLQELPLLEHLHVDDAILSAPAWEELHVRGCWSLRRLPRLRQQPDNAVKVSGERAWWTKLRWDGAPSRRGSYEVRLPPASTSIRERVVIRTYLR